MEEVDCVVVGAGWYGLAAAKQIHCTQPTSSLTILESEASIGGTWGDGRLYPGLRSNNLLGTYEYPDFPMDTETFGVKTHEHIPGPVINKYLKVYAERFGIADLVRLQTKVLVADHQDDDQGGWILTLKHAEQQHEYKLYARRLVLATGRYSDPFLPHFAGQETFGGRIFHGKQFSSNRDTLETAKAVTVFGASKSAWDAVYAYAIAGVKVNWIIRPHGHGSCWMAPPFVTPLKQWIEMLANTRFLTWFSPCIWGDADGYSCIRSFLHGTAIGRGIVNTFWSILGNDVLTLMNFDAHPETAKLKPRMPPMFTGDSFSILNYDADFMELVKSDIIQIRTAEFDHLSPGKVHLSDGSEFVSDAMLASTGWKHVPPLKFLPEGIEKELGLPHEPSQCAPAEDLANQHELIQQADVEILDRFPRLKDQPVWNKDYVPVTEAKGIETNDSVTPHKQLTPYMLHRFIVPPSERFLRHRDIAITGMSGNFSNTITAHIQGLWISAYFQGRLAKDPAAAVGNEAAMHDLRYQTVLHNRWGRWRYPTDWGNKAPSFIFDAVPYLDLLQKDLGLSPHRKGGVVAEMWSPYMAKDYRTINEEWARGFGSEKVAIYGV
ncbi:dimethylaniline monooxygenase (N-oxide forming) [Hortaea werneckii]|nr:dimethylaniline monooxygenase (N-oxide forming) [Hortaea werneckii]